MADRQPLKIVVAGVGSFSQRVLIPGLAACPEADLVALFGPTPDKTRDIAQKNGVPRSYSHYEQMLDAERPDAVVVATPNDVHHAMVLRAIERGCAVFCEKPLGLTVTEAQEMADAARAKGARTAVNFTYRSTNPMRLVERLMKQDRLGRLFHFNISFYQNIRADPNVPLAYRMLRERGGGALLDIGVHMMDLLRWWFGEIDSVCGQAATVIPERPTTDGGRGQVTADDVTSFIVKLSNGVAGTVQVSQVAYGRQNYRRVELFGSNGSLIAEEDRNFGPEVRSARPGDVTYSVEPIQEDVHVSFEAFPRFHLSRIVAALRGDTDDWPNFEDGVKAQRAVDAVAESQRSGTWVQLA